MLRLRRPILVLTAILFLAARIGATWSIVAVNLATGEVAVASATCLTGFNLKKWLPVIIPEIGAACAQSAIDVGAVNRIQIRDMMLDGVPPDAILQVLAGNDGAHQSRQYGMVDMRARNLTFTGSNAGGWAGGVTGRIGDIVYAIQGNVLTGQPVVDEAELAFASTQGDLSQRLMAAMEAARSMGGDGRCSCDPFDPEACGAPPPSFSKSAHVGFVIVARPGDELGPCSVNTCARGPYYLSLNVANQIASDPDPVITLQQDYAVWRAAMSGRPDAVLSTVQSSHAYVTPGAGTVVDLFLDLHDIDGIPVVAGGAVVTLQHDDRSAGLSTLRSVTDHGDGTYSVAVDTGAAAGLDLLRLVVDDGLSAPVTLWPPVKLLHKPVQPLPLAEPQALPGLDSGRNDAQPFLMDEDRVAYLLSNRYGGRLQLMRTERPSVADAFGPAVVVPGFEATDLVFSDFWVSSDELRLYLSAKEPPEYFEQLWFTERPDLATPFPAPEPIVELIRPEGSSGAWLTPDERTIWFHTTLVGARRLWRAERLTRTAQWFPPHDVLITDHGEAGFPTLTEGGVRVYFVSFLPGRVPFLEYADLLPAGYFDEIGRPSGIVHDLSVATYPSSFGADGTLHLTQVVAGGADALAAEQVADALTASGDTASVLGRDKIVFEIDGGPGLAGAAYALLAGASGPDRGHQIGEAVMPFGFDSLTAMLVGGPNEPPFQYFFGTLDDQGGSKALLKFSSKTSIPAALLDRTWTFAFHATDGIRVLVSNPVFVRVLP
ncbi:MAG TPA: DUF1028 domain-containing protein [Planctomycetota bacterium]